MSLATSTAINSTVNLSLVSHGSDSASQMADCADAAHSNGQPVNNQATASNQTPPTTPRGTGQAHQRPKFTPPPRVVPRSPRSLSKFSIDSPQQSRGRSESSPASLASPSKPTPTPTPTAMPLAAPQAMTQTTPSTTPQATPSAIPSATPKAAPSVTPVSHLPSLALSALTGDTISDASPPPSPTKLMRLRASKRISSSLKSMFAEKGSASAPTTPRKTSASASDRPTAFTAYDIKSPNKLRSPEIEAQPSPRKLDHELIILSNEVADHWVRAIQAGNVGTKGLRASDSKLFLGQAVKIPVDKFSPELLKRLPAPLRNSSITHSALIATLYGKAFDASPAGKTLLAARRSVMHDYGDATLTLAELESRAESDPEVKKRYKQNMEDRTLDCVKFLFDASAGQAPGAEYSEELVALWQAMDNRLVSLNLGKTERERLAYELVLSRMVLRAAKGNDSEAGLAVPALFLATVKEVSATMFPSFRDQVLKQFDSKRVAPISTAATDVANLSNSSASSSSTTSSNNQPQ